MMDVNTAAETAKPPTLPVTLTASDPIQNFVFEDHQVRIVDRNGEPWFVAADVCRVLGHSNTTMAVRLVGQHEQAKSVLGGGSPVNLVSESGLYKLILRSDKAAARPFQNWVTATVLPAIRKDGAYIAGEEAVATGQLSEDEFLLKAFEILKTKAERLTAENRALQNRNTQLQDHLLVAEEHFAAPSRQSLARFARTLNGLNSNRIKPDLLNLGYLYRMGGVNRVYSKYRDTYFLERRNTAGQLDIFPTDAGCALLVRLYREGKLTMRRV